ncbi:MAG TPA: cytochrome c-type biogenesis protein CcmH, partial [Thermoanaerobaculia bacterium]|nr:cytochrome c-type biogenesis protein CcmH [Thermoanaerobaculia bacterium]
ATDIDGKLKVPDAAQFVGPPQGQPRSGAALAEETHRIGVLLRCPVCQGMSVADSPAEMAVNMKGQVRELVARGYTEEQILKYFELSYGQFVLLKPKFEGVTGMVWVLPVVALLIGGVVVYFTLKRLQQSPTAKAADIPPPTANQSPAGTAAEEDPYLARVRELVSGDKS